jgi:hypothetical protein
MFWGTLRNPAIFYTANLCNTLESLGLLVKKILRRAEHGGKDL